jgi:signal transduction histidine kinase/CHASE2 domain-containing sensor protein
MLTELNVPGTPVNSLPRRRLSALVATSVAALSAVFGTVAVWQAPGLDRYSRDWLFRLRGPSPVSGELALVAIDDASVARFGRFPWSRSLLARAVDLIASGQPKAIALDILFTDPTTAAEDHALASSIAQARNVILGAELIDRGPYGGGSLWLRPLGILAAGAAGVGHVNAGIESDGTARQVLFEESDDEGHIIRALPVEAFRVGHRMSPDAIVAGGSQGAGTSQVAIGPYSVPVGRTEAHRAARISIDYAGPPGAFAAQQYSMADIMEGRVAPGVLRDKYVLVGATAASLGERFASPFTHDAGAQGNQRGANQYGAAMPGVEVLANALNTILNSRFYSDMPDAAAFALSALAAWLMLTLLSLAPGNRAGLRLLAALAAGVLLILFASYECFARFLIFPPLVSALLSFGAAGILGLAAISFEASAALDRGIRQALRSLPEPVAPPGPDEIAESIVRITDVTGALLSRSGKVLGAWGFPGPRPAVLPAKTNLPNGMATTEIRLGGDSLLLLLHPWSAPPPRNAMRIAEALAWATLAGPESAPNGSAKRESRTPESLEEKARRIVHLNERISRQAEFFHSSMKSVEDGLIVASPEGRIRFANERAGIILNSVLNSALNSVLNSAPENQDVFAALAIPAAEMLETLLLNRKPAERELAVQSRRYIVRIAPVVNGEGVAFPVIGIVVSLSDVTRQYELAKTRNDVVALVSHEMRTPLTAIQGMTELLAAYEIEPVRRREMTLAINDEVKRLARMIGDYLDITKLEMSKAPLRLAPLRLEALVERSLLLFEPLAEEKSIRLFRHFGNALSPVLGDADLLARVFSNLISNALKYSPCGTEVEVSMRASEGGIAVKIEDRGYGIPEQDRERIFEKFYRVPRLEDVDVPGTGLGLTFVREIVELHGGTVQVQSKPGVGSVFTVFLPCGSPAPAR